MSDFGLAGEIPVASRFIFEIDGVNVATFNEIEGLEMRVDVVTFAEGGQNGFVHQLPGRASWPTLIMRRGTISNDDALWKWITTTTGDQFEANSNKLERKTAAITVMSGTGQRMRSWELIGAWPCYWKLSTMSVDAREPLGEEIHIKHHGFKPKTLAT